MGEKHTYAPGVVSDFLKRSADKILPKLPALLVFLCQKCSSASALTLTLANLIIKVGGRASALAS